MVTSENFSGPRMACFFRQRSRAKGNSGYILGLYGDNGKENGNYYNIGGYIEFIFGQIFSRQTAQCGLEKGSVGCAAIEGNPSGRHARVHAGHCFQGLAGELQEEVVFPSLFVWQRQHRHAVGSLNVVRAAYNEIECEVRELVLREVGCK